MAAAPSPLALDFELRHNFVLSLEILTWYPMGSPSIIVKSYGGISDLIIQPNGIGWQVRINSSRDAWTSNSAYGYTTHEGRWLKPKADVGDYSLRHRVEQHFEDQMDPLAAQLVADLWLGVVSKLISVVNDNRSLYKTQAEEAFKKATWGNLAPPGEIVFSR